VLAAAVEVLGAGPFEDPGRYVSLETEALWKASVEHKDHQYRRRQKSGTKLLFLSKKKKRKRIIAAADQSALTSIAFARHHKIH